MIRNQGRYGMGLGNQFKSAGDQWQPLFGSESHSGVTRPVTNINLTELLEAQKQHVYIIPENAKSFVSIINPEYPNIDWRVDIHEGGDISTWYYAGNHDEAQLAVKLLPGKAQPFTSG